MHHHLLSLLSSFFLLHYSNDDDVQIYTSASVQDLGTAIVNVNKDLTLIQDWSVAHGLQINPKKTQAIILGSSRSSAKVDWTTLPKIVFDGVTVPFSSSVKNLGLLMDSDLSWVPQLDAVSRKIFASAASLRRLRNFLPVATKILLAQSLLFPILDYADVCYLDVTEQQLDKLERLQNVCIRFIFGLRKFDHISEFRKQLKWLPIRLRRNTHILCLLYNILFNPLTPPYLKERFPYKANVLKLP